MIVICARTDMVHKSGACRLQSRSLVFQRPQMLRQGRGKLREHDRIAEVPRHVVQLARIFKTVIKHAGDYFALVIAPLGVLVATGAHAVAVLPAGEHGLLRPGGRVA